jgi:hypothetical protein
MRNPAPRSPPGEGGPPPPAGPPWFSSNVRYSSRNELARFNFSGNSRANFAMRFAQIAIRLEPEPPPRGKAEISIETQASVDGNGAGTGQDCRDPGLGHPDILRQPIRRDSQRREKLFPEHFAGRGQWEFSLGHERQRGRVTFRAPWAGGTMSRETWERSHRSSPEFWATI